MIRIVTDSSSQLPEELRARYDITVVPIRLTINGTEYREGVDLDADAFYAFWDDGQPEVATSQPSPGDFVTAYLELVEQGATEIVSIHVGSAFSGTLNSARIAAERLAIPVHLVDTNTVSFGVSCCVWEAADAIGRGLAAEHAAAVAAQLAPSVGSVSILQALEFTRAQGRLVEFLPPEAEGIPVLALVDGEARTVGEGRSIDDLCQLMVDEMVAGGEPIRAALCIADQSAAPFYQAMDAMLRSRPEVVDLVHYRVGPSIGAFVGPGAAGGFWYGCRDAALSRPR